MKRRKSCSAHGVKSMNRRQNPFGVSNKCIKQITPKQQLTLVCWHNYWQVKATCFVDMYFLVWWIIWVEGGLYPGAMKVNKEIKYVYYLTTIILPYSFRIFLGLKQFYRTVVNAVICTTTKKVPLSFFFWAGKFQFRLVTFPPYQPDWLVAKKN